METKIFLIKEHETTLFEPSEIEQWKTLVNELGLVEQERLIKQDKSPLPFSLMTEAEDTIYKKILPQQEDYKKYSTEAIPLQVLDVIALCLKEQYFDKIQIWYNRNNPDPIVVGRTYTNENARTNDYSWNMNNYIIAQWGPKIKPLKDLLPLYDQYMNSEIEKSYKYALEEHNRNMVKFNFTVNSFE